MAGRQRSPNPAHPAPTCAVALVRCSDERQEHSVGDQRAEIERWCQQEGHELLRVFEDEGISGSKLDRPGLTALLEFVEAHPRKGVVAIWRRNRLARPDDPRDGLLLERRIERAGWKIHFLQGAQPSGNPLVDTLMATIEHHQAGEFLRGLAADTVRGIVRRFLAGEATPGGAIPFGYAKRVTWQDGSEQTFARAARQRVSGAKAVRFVPGDPSEVAIVRRIFTRYAEGVGFATLAGELNRDRIASPSGGRWRANTIAQTLRNPIYAGHVALGRRCAGKVAKMTAGQTIPRPSEMAARDHRNPRDEWLVLEDQHEPLIDRKLLALVQAELLRRGDPGNQRRRNRATYPLSGLLFCQLCGNPMGGACPRNRPTREYRCGGYARDRSCTAWGIRADRLEECVLRKLQQVFVPQADLGAFREKVLAVLQRRVGDGGVRPDVVALEKELSSIEGKIAQGTENLLMVRGQAAAQLASKLEALSERKSELMAEIEKVNDGPGRGVNLGAAADEVVGLVQDLVGTGKDASLATRRAVLSRSVARLELRFETRKWTARRIRHIPVGGQLTPTPVLGLLLEAGGGSQRAATSRLRGAPRARGSGSPAQRTSRRAAPRT